MLLECCESLMLLLLPLMTATVVPVGLVLVAIVGQEGRRRGKTSTGGRGIQRRRRFFSDFGPFSVF